MYICNYEQVLYEEISIDSCPSRYIRTLLRMYMYVYMYIQCIYMYVIMYVCDYYYMRKSVLGCVHLGTSEHLRMYMYEYIYIQCIYVIMNVCM